MQEEKKSGAVFHGRTFSKSLSDYEKHRSIMGMHDFPVPQLPVSAHSGGVTHCPLKHTGRGNVAPARKKAENVITARLNRF